MTLVIVGTVIPFIINKLTNIGIPYYTAKALTFGTYGLLIALIVRTALIKWYKNEKKAINILFYIIVATYLMLAIYMLLGYK